MPVRQLLRFTLLWCGALAVIALAAFYLARIERIDDRREIYATFLDSQWACLAGLLPTGEDEWTDKLAYNRENISWAITQDNPYEPHSGLGPSSETIDAYIAENARWGENPARLKRILKPTCTYDRYGSPQDDYVRFSHIGFNKKGDQALVTIEAHTCLHSRCPFAGHTDLCFFRREHGTWREKQCWQLFGT